MWAAIKGRACFDHEQSRCRATFAARQTDGTAYIGQFRKQLCACRKGTTWGPPKWAKLRGRACFCEAGHDKVFNQSHAQHCSDAGAGLSPACSRLVNGANAKQQQQWQDAVPCLPLKCGPAAAAQWSALP